MHIEATAVGTTTVEVTGKQTEAALVRATRTALSPLEHRLWRVRVRLQASNARHVCLLQAWCVTGQTIVIERRSEVLAAAFDGALASLSQVLKQQEAVGSPRSRSPKRGSPVRRPSSCPEDADSDIAAGKASPSRDTAATRVLLALHDLSASAPSLHWAQLLAGASGADLDVCRVLADMPSSAAMPPGRDWLNGTRKLLRAHREARAWCRQALPDAHLTERVIPGAAEYVNEVALLARQRRVNWIVLPATQGACGVRATALARATSCPVLVAREPKSRYTVLVSTGLDTNNLPALERAAHLVEALHAPILAFHNLHARLAGHAFASQVELLRQAWRRIQEGRATCSDLRLPEIDVLLAYGTNRVDALLAQALREDANMIVVSAAGAEGIEMAAAVVDRAVRSVLVVPGEPTPMRERRPRGGSTVPSPTRMAMLRGKSRISDASMDE